MTTREHEDWWQQRATAVAIQAAKDLIGEPTKVPKSHVVGHDAAIPGGVPIGKLTDTEWGWLLAVMLFGWISVRSEQAVAEGRDTEEALRVTGLAVEPWDAATIGSILEQLAEDPRFDWSKTLNDWSRVEMIEFLHAAFRLIQEAIIARNNGSGITRKRQDDNNLGGPGNGREDRGEPRQTVSGN
jgi:hypothetical protein